MSRLKKSATLLAFLTLLVGGFEGLRTAAYLDPVGIPTICFGETRGVKMGDRKTKAECEAMLGSRLIEFERETFKCVVRPNEIPDPAYVAFLSLSYNIGSGAFCKSTLVRKLNSGDLRGACLQILKWDKAKGIRLPGLVKRRQAEFELCNKTQLSTGWPT